MPSEESFSYRWMTLPSVLVHQPPRTVSVTKGGMLHHLLVPEEELALVVPGMVVPERPVAQGTPQDVARSTGETGRYLARSLG